MSATPCLVGSEQVEGQQESSLSVEQVALLGREPPVSRCRRSHTYIVIIEVGRMEGKGKEGKTVNVST